MMSLDKPIIDHFSNSLFISRTLPATELSCAGAPCKLGALYDSTYVEQSNQISQLEVTGFFVGGGNILLLVTVMWEGGACCI